MLLFIYALLWKKENLHENTYSNFTPKVIIIGFWQIWHFDLTGWMGLELSVILMQTAGRFDMWVTPSTDILTLVKLKFFMSKVLSTKTL